MLTVHAQRILVASFCITAAWFSPLAHAGLFRAYLSVSGNDANPCTVSQPCRLLPAALLAVNDGGEIWILDSANFNTSQVNIAKSVSILAVPGVVGSVVATSGGDAIKVNAAGVKVTLRNLVVAKLGANHHGIEFAQGAELIVEDCEISGASTDGIHATADSAKITVRNTVLRDNGQDGFVAAGFLLAVLDRVQSVNNGVGIHASNGAQVSVSNSVMWHNAFGAFASNDSNGIDTTELVVAHSTVGGNVYGLYVLAGPDPSESANLTSDDNLVTHNSAAFQVGAGTGSMALYSRGNNTVRANDGVGGPLTALGGV